jgi:hypothetical protein
MVAQFGDHHGAGIADAMANTGLFKGGGDGGDFALGAGKGGGDVVQNLEAGGVDTVVIGDENVQWGPRCLGVVVVEGGLGGKRGSDFFEEIGPEPLKVPRRIFRKIRLKAVRLVFEKESGQAPTCPLVLFAALIAVIFGIDHNPRARTDMRRHHHADSVGADGGLVG